MKKILACILSLALALSLSVAGALAEEENLFETLSKLDWEFTSGAGGWSTDMKLTPTGSFTGNFHDSEMGETGEGYPNGTLYYAAFNGQASLLEKVDDLTWKIRIDALKVEVPAGYETIEDDIRYVSAEVYGLAEGDEMTVYAPGTPVSALTDSMQMWAHLFDTEVKPTALENWFIYSPALDTGFTGFDTAALSIPNPWTDVTAEQLMELSGMAFNVPKGAEEVSYYYLAESSLAEMTFTLNGQACCARISPIISSDGHIEDISGLYYNWETSEDTEVGTCPAIIKTAREEDGTQIKLCIWHDIAPGITYSLSVKGKDLDNAAVRALAEEVYIPTQGDS